MRSVVVNTLCFASSVALIGAAGCAPEFEPASLITSARVIAVVAQPPEATPGEVVELTPLIASPSGTLVEGDGYDASWWRCPDDDADALGDFTQCTVPAERRELGGGSPYVDTVPLDLFGEVLIPGPAPGAEPPTADATPKDKMLGALLGFWRIVGLTMDAPADAEGKGAARVDSFKRIPVYLPFPLGDVDERLRELDVRVDANGVLRANSNPILQAVTIHEGAVDGPTVDKVKKGETYFFVPRVDDRSLEDFGSLKADLSGLDITDPDSLAALGAEDLLARFARVERCEVPLFNWYVSAGELDREITLDESVISRVFDPRGVACPPVEGEVLAPEVEFTAPTGDKDDPLPEDDVVHGWVVLRDGRGGTAVRSFDLPVE
ncbi:MAG: hypothetical protein Q8O67_18905 [Deltaproteobacteria bacterium]|nr:hypothetical protein [Deltaproteobacteria bacterium]